MKTGRRSSVFKNHAESLMTKNLDLLLRTVRRHKVVAEVSTILPTLCRLIRNSTETAG